MGAHSASHTHQMKIQKVSPETGSLTINRVNAGEIVRNLYERYHRPEYIHPDPIEIVHEADPSSREIAALVASSLALGQVDLILKAARDVLRRIGRPAELLRHASLSELLSLFAGFRYRFFAAEHLAGFLVGIGECLRRYGSIEGCFLSCCDPCDEDLVPAMGRFVTLFRSLCPADIGILLSDPAKGSACKRLALYLRWMTRRDAIDPGGWRLSPALLVVPVDVHMLRVSTMLGFTTRRTPDLKAAREITRALREICPEDPVKFDFCMTRLGINPRLSYADLLDSRNDD